MCATCNELYIKLTSMRGECDEYRKAHAKVANLPELMCRTYEKQNVELRMEIEVLRRREEERQVQEGICEVGYLPLMCKKRNAECRP